ncbi:DUF6233 domain-containing protein [Streptomyces triculaminicus]|uniref:DUF6233 domain-containing protein n=1 Tax=Streptomyces triculaminicus TaxID=2816232 RepID=UPI00340E86B1
MPERTPTPQTWVRLQDGQEIIGRLHRRWQSSDGSWYYEVSITLWAHAVVHGRDVAEPADITFSAPASHVSPVPGASYKGVPVRRHPAVIARARTGRKPPVMPQPGRAEAGWPQVREDGSDRWSVQHLRYAYDSTAPRPVVVHHSSCFAAKGPAELSTAQAVEALRRPGAKACDMCGADRLLAR